MFSQKIKELNQVSAREQQSFITVAKVIEADELNNCCHITFDDNYGQERHLNSVPYLISDPKFSGYFPSKNDLVYIQCHDNKNYLIIGPYYRRDNLLRNSVYKSEFNKMYFKDYGISEGSIL